jgi:hypothetical protein
MIRIRLTYSITWYLVVAMFILGIAPRVDAGLSSSDFIAQPEFSRSADMNRIMKVIETKMVRERLEQLGFTQEEIQSRLNQLTEKQLHRFASTLDELKVGGDGLGIVIALLVIAILVVLLLQLTGHKVLIK